MPIAHRRMSRSRERYNNQLKSLLNSASFLGRFETTSLVKLRRNMVQSVTARNSFVKYQKMFQEALVRGIDSFFVYGHCHNNSNSSGVAGNEEVAH